MADYSAIAYLTANRYILSPDEMLDWSTATIGLITGATARLEVRGGGIPGFPRNYDLILGGVFTANLGNTALTSGLVSSIQAVDAATGVVVAQLTGLSIDMTPLLVSGPPQTFLSPDVATILTGQDTLRGDAWGDELRGYGGRDQINGNGGDDVLEGMAGDDIINGGDGNDTLLGGANADLIDGGLNNDSIDGGNGIDTITGDDGLDTIRGGAGLDSLDGGANNDRFEFATGDVETGETITGGGGTDRLAVDDGQSVDFNSAILTSVEKLQIGNGASVGIKFAQIAGALLDEVIGGAGAQTLTIQIESTSGQQGPNADLSVLTLTSWAAADLVVVNGGFGSDTITGTAGRDSIVGSVGNDSVIGGAGDDTLIGGTYQDDVSNANGDDTLYGGAGLDALYGNGGSDRFIYIAPAELVAGETIDGGPGPDATSTNGLGDALEINGSGTFDFRSTTIASLEHIDLSSTTGNVTVLLNGSQDEFQRIFGSAAHPGYVLTVEFAGSNVDLRRMGVHDWDSNDAITLIGTNTLPGSANFLAGNATANTIVGTDVVDNFIGYFGADSLLGFNGDDAFFYQPLYVEGAGTFTQQASIGETIDGGAGFDSIVLVPDATEDFRTAIISGIEAIVFALGFEAAPRATATFADSQIGGTSLLQSVDGEDQPTLDENGDPLLPSNVAQLIVTGSITNLSTVVFTHWDSNDIVRIEGTAGNETLTGSGQGDIMSGFAGADSLIGGFGNDVLNGGDQNDTLVGGDGNDSLSGDNNNDLLVGHAGNDTLRGASDNDTLRGGFGVDNQDGGDNDDVIQIGVNEWEPLETITGGDGIDTLAILDNGTYDFSTGTVLFMERLLFDVSDTVNATFGNTIFDDPFSGITSIAGTAGGPDEVINLTIVGSVVQMQFMGFSDWTANDRMTLVGNSESDLLRGTSQNDSVSGGSGTDTLIGEAGNDTLDGGTGADNLNGGDGADFFYVDNTVDVVIEGSGAASGYDIVMASANYTLSDNVEQLVIQGGATQGTGGNTANYLYGGNSGLSLRLDGGDGDDVIYAGLAGGNTLIGGSGVDTLLIYGGDIAANNANGGLGADIYYTYSVNDVLSEVGGDGIDTVYSSHNITLAAGFEQLLLFGTATSATGSADNNIMYGNSTTGPVNLSGLNGSDVLVGGAFNDTLDGGIGVDLLFGYGGTNTLTGGDDADVYYLETAGNIITETTTGGFDTIYTNFAGTTTMAANVEQLILYGNATGGTGTGGNDYLYANSAAGPVTLDGGGGADYLLGSAFADTLIGGAGGDRFALSQGGIDHIRYNAAGNMGADTVFNFDAAANDLIDLTGRGYVAGNIGSAITIATFAGGTLVTFASGSLAGTTINLTGVAVGNVTGADFVF